MVLDASLRHEGRMRVPHFGASKHPNGPQAEHGITTIESIIVLSLLAIVLLGVTGLHLVAISTGTVAETSSVAMNLARAHLEALLAMPPDQIVQQDNVQTVEQVAAGRGPAYTIHTAVDAGNPAHLDIVVTVTWHTTFNAACASRRCAGDTVTYSRTLRTRILRLDNGGS